MRTRTLRAVYGSIVRPALSSSRTCISQPTFSRFFPRMDLSTEATERRGSVHHDTHATPPLFIQNDHWRYQNMKRADVDTDPTIFNLSNHADFAAEQKDIWRPAGTIPAAQIQAACEAYAGGKALSEPVDDAPIFEHRDFPGLQVIPGLLPPETQVRFTSCLLHRDLADPHHKINLQADYTIPYPASPPTDAPPFSRTFFTRDRAAPANNLVPNDPAKNKPLNTEQFLYSKLRWLTLGEQYDWPTRSYAKHATPFPTDLSTLVTGLFPHIRPESGVVLIYSAKDFMPVHRDVSEQCARALASFSLGCDGIFVIARGEDGGTGEDAPRTVAIRVRSGDCVHLRGEARWAWHAMARTLPGTCPEWLGGWPVGSVGGAEEKRVRKWKGYMGTKRVNVSCRQVWD